MKLNTENLDMPPEHVVERLLEALKNLSELTLASEAFMRAMYKDHIAGKKELSQETQDLAMTWANQTMKASQFMHRFADQAGVAR